MKLLKPIHPNVGTEADFRKALQSLIDEMAASTLYWLRASYKANESRLAMDASPVSELQARIKKLRGRWSKRFADEAGGLAIKFSEIIKRRVDHSLGKQMSVNFRYTDAMRNTMQASVGEQVSLIKSISSEYFDDIEGIVLRSAANGRDLKYMTDELMKRYNVTRNRAVLIARDQNNKATAQIVATRQLELGLTKAVWIHSGGGKTPRQSHVKAGRDKLVFDIKQGAYIDGEYIRPGEMINCRCVSRAVIPE
jgi:uncharacterized protein with gpF-like domain